MAYISQEEKKEFTPAIKAVLKKYGVSGTLSIKHYSTLVCSISKGELDIIGAKNKMDSQRFPLYDDSIYDLNGRIASLKKSYIDVNEYHIKTAYDGPMVVSFLQELKAAMEGPRYYNHDDINSDYHHRSHYTDICVGRYNKPYICTGQVYCIDDYMARLKQRVIDSGGDRPHGCGCLDSVIQTAGHNCANGVAS